jgi:hypothetical protein
VKKKKTKVSVLEEKEEEKNPSIPRKNQNIKNAIAVLSKQNNHSRILPFQKKRKHDSLCVQ